MFPNEYKLEKHFILNYMFCLLIEYLYCESQVLHHVNALRSLFDSENKVIPKLIPELQFLEILTTLNNFTIYKNPFDDIDA